MADIDPFVRHMLVCDDVQSDPANPGKLTLRGLVHAIRLKAPARLPAEVAQLCVLLFLTGGRGVGRAQVRVAEADTDQTVFISPVYRVTYPADPLELVTRMFRVQQCILPRTGLNWVEFWHNDSLLAEQPLIVR